MAVAESWHDGTVTRVNDFLGRRDVYVSRGADRADRVARDRHDAIIDDWTAGHRQHGPIDDCDVGHCNILTVLNA